MEPAEYLAVQMVVGDPYNVSGVLEQARPGQPLTVVVRFANLGQEEVTLDVSCPPFRVTTRDGEVVGPSTAGCTGPSSHVTVWPGGVRTFVGQWAGEDSTGTTMPTAAYGLEAWIRRVDRFYPVATGIEWVCLVPDSTPPPSGSRHDCGLPGDPLPSRNLPSRQILPQLATF